jgi:hypothetical protein
MWEVKANRAGGLLNNGRPLNSDIGLCQVAPGFSPFQSYRCPHRVWAGLVPVPTSASSPRGVPSEYGLRRRHSPLAASTFSRHKFACVRHMDWAWDASGKPLCFFSGERLSVLHGECSLPPSMQSLEFRLEAPRQRNLHFWLTKTLVNPILAPAAETQQGIDGHMQQPITDARILMPLPDAYLSARTSMLGADIPVTMS